MIFKSFSAILLLASTAQATPGAAPVAPPAPAMVGDVTTIGAAIEPVAGEPLTFRAGNTRPAQMDLIPQYRLHHERYTVYWPVYSEAEWRAQAAGRTGADAD